KWISKRVSAPDVIPANWKYIPKVKPTSPPPHPRPTKPVENGVTSDFLEPEEEPLPPSEDPLINLANTSDIERQAEEEGEAGADSRAPGTPEAAKKSLDTTTIALIVIL